MLSYLGFPGPVIRAIQKLYFNDVHVLKLGGSLFPSITIHSGVRQGCPLSPTLFAIALHPFLKQLESCTRPEECLRAFADDIAMANWQRSIPAIACVFHEFIYNKAVSALRLNIKKTHFIPLWKVSSNGCFSKPGT